MNYLPRLTTGAFTPSDGGSASVGGDALNTPASLAPSPITPNSPSHDELPPSLPPFRIAIIGGGIGGLTAALFIDQLCNTPAHRKVEISIYEQASEFKDIGAGIGLGPNATKLFARLDSNVNGTHILDAINAISGSRDGVWFIFRRFDNGEEIITVPRNEPEDSRIRFVAVNRAELHAILLQHVKAKPETIGNRLFTGKKLAYIEPSDEYNYIRTSTYFPTMEGRDGCNFTNPDERVLLKFHDGSTAYTDFVIAADGIHSMVRRQFVADWPIYGNKIIYRGLFPMSALPTPWPMPSHVVMWNGIGAHFVMYPISANKTINIIACKDKDISELDDDLAHESWVATCDRSELENDFADFTDPLVREVIRLMPQTVSKWRINDRHPARGWVFMDGQVVLLGDAAHPMVPHQSAGAGQAVEDGYILAKALSRFLLLSNDDTNSAENGSEPLNNTAAESLQDKLHAFGEAILREAGYDPDQDEDMHEPNDTENSQKPHQSDHSDSTIPPSPLKPVIQPTDLSSSPPSIQLEAVTEPGPQTADPAYGGHTSADSTIFEDPTLIEPFPFSTYFRPGEEFIPLERMLSDFPLEEDESMLSSNAVSSGATIETTQDTEIALPEPPDWLEKKNRSLLLHRCMILYENVRMPRAAGAQASSRKAGDLFEVMGPEMEGKSYDERLAVLKEQARENMKWLWTEDIDAAWEKGLAEMD